MLTGREIGLRIKGYREKRSISQQVVVEELDKLGIKMSRETFSKIETGNRNVSAPELKAICEIIDVDVNVLLEDDEDNEETLVKLFRKKNINGDSLDEIEDLESMIICFFRQMKLELNINKKYPLWRK